MSFFDFRFDDNSAHSKKVSSFFDDTEESKKKERQGPSLEDEGEDEDNDHSEVKMKVPKKTKVDTSLGPVHIEFANITDKDVNDNSKGIKVDGNSSDNSMLSDNMRDAIEKMRSQMLAMIPDIKRQEEASDTILGRVTVLEADINNYREQLAEVKHEYTSRLSLVSSILQEGH